jgi:hypothetical protein
MSLGFAWESRCWSEDSFLAFRDERLENLRIQVRDEIPDPNLPLVYFIKCQNHIKIGWTRGWDALPNRIAAMQTGNPIPLELIGVIQDDEQRRREKMLHQVWKPYQGEVGKEWFIRCRELDRFIGFLPLGTWSGQSAMRIWKRQPAPCELSVKQQAA